uniref:Uncharacterized protein n=1 Tax=Physcomitrium patens TaxID=3218 RepID=A0A2K1K6Y2_PHYPA|nr:hypothetical protein PHYPA_011423 [Physcomitrium patens]
MINGVCEEYVYNRLQFSYGWYFTFVQSFVYLILISSYGFRPKHIVNPWKTYIKLSAVLMGSQGLTKGSLMFLNYPAQILFKFTKVLPVMVMGAFVPGLKRRYTVLEYISAILLVLGLVTFTLPDAQTSPNFSLMGVMMVVGPLVLDAFVGNLQEVIFTLNPTTTQTRLETPLLSRNEFTFSADSSEGRDFEEFLAKLQLLSSPSALIHALRATVGDAFLFYCSRITIPHPTYAHHKRIVSCLVQLLLGQTAFLLQLPTNLSLFMASCELKGGSSRGSMTFQGSLDST